MNARRLYGPVVLATLATGGLAFFAASRSWAHAQVRAAGLPTDGVSVSGSSAQPLVPALALVAVTAALAVLASSPRVRRAVGVLTVLVALAGGVVVLTGGSTLDDAVTRAVSQSSAFTGSNTPDTQHTWWRALTVVAFVLVGACGVVTARLGALWPTMGRRYEAPAARPSGPAVEATQTDMWKALDEGRDPTQ